MRPSTKNKRIMNYYIPSIVSLSYYYIKLYFLLANTSFNFQRFNLPIIHKLESK